MVCYINTPSLSNKNEAAMSPTLKVRTRRHQSYRQCLLHEHTLTFQ